MKQTGADIGKSESHSPFFKHTFSLDKYQRSTTIFQTSLNCVVYWDTLYFKNKLCRIINKNYNQTCSLNHQSTQTKLTSKDQN